MTAALPLVVSAIVRWVSFAALATLIGGLVLESLLAPPVASSPPAVRQALRRWMRWCIVALLLTTLADLLLRAQTMSAGGLGLAIAAVPTVLSRTHFGTIWIGRVAAVGLALALTFVPHRRARLVALVVALGVALTTSLSGHAADRGSFTVDVLADWIHMVAASAWAGGLLAFAIAAFPSARAWPPAGLAWVARRFSRLAGLCLLAVVLTGTYNAWQQVRGVAPLWTTAYGRTLIVKLAFVLMLVSLGAVNRWTIVPRLGPGRPVGGLGFRLVRLLRLAIRGRSRRDRGALPSRFAAYVSAEAVLVALVLAATAALTDITPARHARHLQHGGEPEAEQGPYRVTMDELHAGGGVPEGWRFRLPAGDPAQGRQVFARLECFACHTVAGEDFPTPSGAGPDLTDMGAHHPAAYLAESVMNPNAVIVKGRGYTDASGRSTMPEYRDSLSLGDLIDLVGYLKRLGGDSPPVESRTPARER